MPGRPFAPRRYHQGAVGEGDENTGRNHVDPVRPYFDPWLDLFDRHSGRFGKNFRQHTVVAWVEMLHQHKRHSGIGWQRMKKLCIRFQAARRGSYGNYWEWRIWGRSLFAETILTTGHEFGRTGLHFLTISMVMAGSAPARFLDAELRRGATRWPFLK
jgi:hypothetical protein